MEAYTKEELTALYRRQVGMVYQICLPDLSVLRLLPGKAFQFLRSAPAGPPPVLQLIFTLIPGGDDEPCLFMLRITKRLCPFRRFLKDGWPSISTIIRAIPPRRPPASWAVSPPPSVPGSFGGETG